MKKKIFAKIKRIRDIISNFFFRDHLITTTKKEILSSEEKNLISNTIWDNSKEQYQKGNFKIYWELLPAIEKYQMKYITGDENLNYFVYAINYTKEKVGDKNLRGLFIGCIEGNPSPDMSLMETGLYSKIDVMDIAEGLLKKQRMVASERGLKEIEYINQDFNKFILERNQYDVIWAIGTVHHIEKLEHLFDQVQNALKDNGIFIIREYIGANRFQYSETQLKIINEILSILPEKYKIQEDGITVKKNIERPDIAELIKHDPTESVRSEDIIPLVKERFEIIKLAYTGGTILHPLLSYIASNFERDEDAETILKLLILFEKTLIDNEVLPSDYVFCIAKKRICR
ncbi:Methyltransferase domain protein [uncultured archaeon]|nr:Methyltransferase domain protein [uncultured archaeon]